MTDRSASLLSTIRSVLDASPPAVAEPGTLRCHTLFSIPRHVKSLYPLAHIHPHDLEHNKRAASIAAYEEQIFVTASWIRATAEKDAEDEAEAPLLVLAMELYLYTIPESGAAVLYISKLDTTGYGPRPIPTGLRESLSKLVFADEKTSFGNTLTATLSSAVTQHFTTFRHWDSAGGVVVSHVSVHILARSQRAYLFPSSPENKDKKVLSDGGLIKWWRAVMSDVIAHTRDEAAPVRKAADSKGPIDARAFYLIPGYSKAESHPLVPLVREGAAAASTSRSADHTLSAAGWVYGHPYSAAGASCSESELPPLPLHWQNSSFVLAGSHAKNEVVTDPGSLDYEPSSVRTVPTLMPHFNDDPKTRFLDETARDAHEHSGWKKKTPHPDAPVSAAEESHEEEQNGAAEPAHLDAVLDGEASNKRAAESEVGEGGTLKRAKTEEAGEARAGSGGMGVPLVTLRAMMREREAMDDLGVDEFWERMAFRQECCAGNAVGVLVVLFTRLPEATATAGDKTVERQPLSLPYKVLGDLVFKSLMKDSCEWNKPALARSLTKAWFQGVDREVRRKGGVAQHFGDPGNHDALIGQHVIWAEFDLVAPSNVQLDTARQAQTTHPAKATQPPTMLSVKRKKPT